LLTSYNLDLTSSGTFNTIDCAVSSETGEADENETATKPAASDSFGTNFGPATAAALNRSIAYLRYADKVKRDGAVGRGCGGNETPTSLERTAEAFWRRPPLIVVEDDSDSEEALFVDIDFVFDAIDENGRRRRVGGDYFVVAFWGWAGYSGGNATVGDRVAYKTAVHATPATDLNNTNMDDGTYRATIRIPNLRPLSAFNVSLMHYYTCHYGLGYYHFWNRGERRHHQLNFGPVQIPGPAHASLSVFLLRSRQLQYAGHTGGAAGNTTTETTPRRHADTNAYNASLYGRRPLCETSQEGIDRYGSGFWYEVLDDRNQRHRAGDEITWLAKWTPYSCQAPVVDVETLRRPNGRPAIRVGDSMMPFRTIEIGLADDVTKRFYSRWVEFLSRTIPSKYDDRDTMMLSAGLHQLLYGYNPETAVTLVLRMLCQLAAVFPGKMILMGPPPIQQHMNRLVDMTDQNVLLVNYGLRRAILESNGRLADICANIDVDRLFGFSDLTNGNALSQDATDALLRYGNLERKNERNVTERQVMNLARRLRSLSSSRRSQTNGTKHNAYGDRVVWFADIHSVLRPRAECNRVADKIHNYGGDPPIGRTNLFSNGQKAFIRKLIAFRSSARDR